MVTILFTSKMPKEDSTFLWYDMSLFSQDEIDDLKSIFDELLATIFTNYESGVKPREFSRKNIPPGHIEVSLDVAKQQVIRIRRSSRQSTKEEEALIEKIEEALE